MITWTPWTSAAIVGAAASNRSPPDDLAVGAVQACDGAGALGRVQRLDVDAIALHGNRSVAGAQSRNRPHGRRSRWRPLLEEAGFLRQAGAIGPLPPRPVRRRASGALAGQVERGRLGCDDEGEPNNEHDRQ